MLKLLAFSIGLLISTNAFPCLGDYDCNSGGKCIKSGYNSSGVCVGGYGTKNQDTGLDYKHKNTNDKKGRSCVGDYECGPGGSCLKGTYSNSGVCNK